MAKRIKSPQHTLLLQWKEEVRQWSSPGGEYRCVWPPHPGRWQRALAAS